MGSQRSKGGALPGIAVIVPARNATSTVDRCLSSLRGQCSERDRLILVDDASTDDTAAVGRAHGAEVFELDERRGPAGARNLAAEECEAELLFFVDADVEVSAGAVEHVRQAFASDPGLAALFGSYDDAPSDPSWIAQYKNLAHHWTHQRARSEAHTFFAACGAVRRDVFLASGGFDAERYPRPAIEDVELGLRLVAAGHRIRLDRSLLAKHLKGWRWSSWLRSDVFDRAVPWTRLALEREGFGDDLNLGWRDRAAAVTATGLAATLALSLISPRWIAAVTVLVMLGVALNYDLYSLFRRKGGWAFAIAGFGLHQVHYAAALTGLLIGAIQHALADPPMPRRASSALPGLRSRR